MRPAWRPHGTAAPASLLQTPGLPCRTLRSAPGLHRSYLCGYGKAGVVSRWNAYNMPEPLGYRPPGTTSGIAPGQGVESHTNARPERSYPILRCRVAQDHNKDRALPGGMRRKEGGDLVVV